MNDLFGPLVFRLRNASRLTMATLFTIACCQCAFAQENAPRPASTTPTRPALIAGTWIYRDSKGEPFGGSIERMSVEGLIWRNADAKGSTRIDWNEVEEIQRNNAETALNGPSDAILGPMILLPGNDRLRGEAVATLAKGLAIQSASIGIVNLPLPHWAGVFDQPPQSQTASMRVMRTLRQGSDAPGDLVLLANGDRLQGTVLELDADHLQLQPLGADKPVSLERKGIQGFAIDPETLEYPEVDGTSWRVHLMDGSRISARALNFESIDAEGAIALTTRWGAEWRVPIAKLAMISVVRPGQIALDAIKPAAVQTVDYIGPTAAPRMGTNIQGGPLKIGGRTFDEGIGTQARTLMAYRLDGTKSTFKAWVGVESSAGPMGQSRAVVLLDGKPVFDSGSMKAGEPPKRIQLDIRGAKLLILASEFGEGGGVRDWVNWCEPTLRP